jgi:hypothetical protein
MGAIHDVNAMKYERLYFAPGEVILHLDCDLNIQPEDVKDFIDILIGPNAALPWSELQWIAEFVGFESDCILLFPRLSVEDQQMVLVPLEMKNPAATQNDLVKLLMVINDRIRLPEITTAMSLGESITLRSASPNWFMTTVHHQGSTGGPGGPPDDASQQPGVPGFNFSQALSNALGDGVTTREVHVAVLDTAPSVADFDLARQSSWFAQHPLKPWIDKQRGMIEYAEDDSVRKLCFERLENFSLLDQHYEMPDHGLFVCGIIHTIAENAALHLYEVLNRSGLGTYYTVAQALSKILESPDINESLIINCSLVLDIPRDRQPKKVIPFDRRTKFFRYTTESVKLLFERIAQLEQVIVVAAAGNDKRKSKPTANSTLQIPTRRPPTRYPAAYHGIIGVGALSEGSQQQDPASYSNISDDPSNTGYLVFGGEVGAGKGVLGVYICRFPDHPQPATPGDAFVPITYKPNTSGLAWWCGTSFATPVISGLLAQYWGSHTSMDAISFLNTASSSTIAGTNERVIIVT